MRRSKLIGTQLRICNLDNEPFNSIQLGEKLSASQWWIQNDIMPIDDIHFDLIIGIDQPQNTPFQNSRKVDWATYKLVLRVPKIRGI